MNCLRFINTYTLTAGPVLTNMSKCQIETQTLSLRLKLWRKVYNSESPRPIFTNIVLYSDFSYRLTGFALCKVDFVKSRKSYPRTFTNCYWCNRPKSQNGCLFPHLNQIFANVKHLKITTTYVSTHILLTSKISFFFQAYLMRKKVQIIKTWHQHA